MVLAAFPMDSLRNTGENLADKITEALSKNGLTLEKMVCCVRDDASNMHVATKLMETESKSISDRVKKLLGNQFLLISTLLDPRFAYDESIFTKLNWSIIEDDLIEYAKRVLKENEANSDANDFQSLTFLDEADQNLQEENSDEDINYDIWKPKSPGTAIYPFRRK
ncbi:hypothetical protein niasHS_007028 [Heterodera schachtii]|uniref:DUF659 domain-containing protein n=1 Tax=Heterodera schachtii TaxID=97005 RepID=A0ABD2JFB6_HETSC